MIYWAGIEYGIKEISLKQNINVYENFQLFGIAQNASVKPFYKMIYSIEVDIPSTSLTYIEPLLYVCRY